jgi:hypothetical protein
MKNKFNIGLVIILLLSVGDCIKATDYPNLDKNISDLSPSMKAFFKIEREPAAGKSFQAIFRDLTKVKGYEEGSSTEYTYYVYEILIAPRTSRPVSIESITVSPTGEIYGYLNRDLNNGRSNLKDWQGFSDKLDFPKWSVISDFTAYRLLITYSDLGNDSMASYGMDPDKLDHGMENVILRIKYDGGEDELNLSFGKKPNVVDSQADPLLVEKTYLKPVLSDGTPEFRLEPLH